MADVTIYTSSTCRFCKAAKEYLTGKNIPYTEKNIDEDQSAVDYLVSKGFRGVPVINIDGEDILGFDQEKIDKKLGLN